MLSNMTIEPFRALSSFGFELGPSSSLSSNLKIGLRALKKLEKNARVGPSLRAEPCPIRPYYLGKTGVKFYR